MSNATAFPDPGTEDRTGAGIVCGAFEAYRGGFTRYTARARAHFEAADWPATQRDSAERLDLYRTCTDGALRELSSLLGARLHDRAAWRALKVAYAGQIQGRADAELAETFFSSVTRRVFTTAGVDPAIEFVHPLAAEPLPGRFDPVLRSCPRQAGTAELVAELLRHHPFANGWEDLARDAARVAAEIDAAHPTAVRALESARPLFFRNKAAYIIGRACREAGVSHPLVIALANPRGRVAVDAALLTEDEASVVFSFTRSYFFVETERPRELVAFLHALLPRKPVSELYDAIGHNKHGKTELYRALLHHLDASEDRFEFAPGQRGMVMVVFTLPSYDLVFKVIRDRFAPPKTLTREEVRSKYRLVFRHDRAGRLVDAQEFEHLRFDRRRFDEALLEELVREASESVELKADSVVVHHAYTERRLRPLDVFLREAQAAPRRAAVVDYGEALRDLARSNIFPGDLLLKNFGVTRHGRVVFYDYDELARLSDCRFRELPVARTDLEEVSAEPWFHVNDGDIFPEEFLPFMGFPGDLQDVFLSHHADLLRPHFWLAMQAEHRAGRIPDIYPYPQRKRYQTSLSAA